MTNMEKENNLLDEKKLAEMLRSEVLKSSENFVEQPQEKASLEEFEYVSTKNEPYISPIMTMSEDEILNFVENFEVAELATLSVAELNRLGEVLGVPPEILTEDME